MKGIKAKPNVFVVNTPHQLLNAIEAVHWFQLTNNHLVVIRPKNGALERFMPLIKVGDWATVSFLAVLIEPRHRVQKLLHPVANRWYCRYLRFRRMHALAKLAARFQHVDKLFLGHYSAEWTPFMRHIANTLKHNTLCLLDDGTDTIKINERRLRSESNELKAPIKKSASWKSAGKIIETHLRAKYFHWYLAEAPCVTFFTIYDLDVRKSDRLIRNNYSYLRSLAPAQYTYMPDTVIFIGDCSVDDWIERNTHFNFLSRVREYFGEKKIIYVAHPRDSASRVTQIKEHLQCELWPSSSVIEYDLIVQGIKPKAVAAFASSALITLAHLMDADVEIVCFYVAPEHWIHWREDTVGVYDYMKRKAQERITIVPLCR